MPNNHLYDHDIVSIKDFTKQDLEFVFRSTDKISTLRPNEKSELGKGRTLGYIFYEPSTRTRMSFEAAMASFNSLFMASSAPGNCRVKFSGNNNFNGKCKVSFS